MRRSGFTLVEMLVATVMMAVAMIALFNTVTAQKQNYEVVDQVSEAQQNLRLIGELIEGDLRHAGFMVPESAAVCGVDRTTAPDSFYVSDAEAIAPDDELTADLAAEFPSGVDNVSASHTIDVDSVVMEDQTPTPAYDTDADGTPDSDFRVGGGVIVFDRADPARGAACGTITDVPDDTTISFTIESDDLGPITGPTPRLAAVPAHHYQVNGNNQLLRDGMLVADEVEDVQIAYFFDADDDYVIDPNEYFADGVGPNYLSGAVDGSGIREARVNLIVRTRIPDEDFTLGSFQARENRAPVAGNDRFRRRVYTATVMLRNTGRGSAL